MSAEEQIALLREIQSNTDPEAFALIVRMAQDFSKEYPAKQPKVQLRLVGLNDR